MPDLSRHMTLHIAVCGSRFKWFRDLEVGRRLVYNLLKGLLKMYKAIDDIVVGHGGNKYSVDAIADEVAKELNIPVEVFAPKKWTTEELLARGRALAEWCDICIAVFVDAVTPGTRYTAKCTYDLGKQVQLYFVDTERGLVKKLFPDEVLS